MSNDLPSREIHRWPAEWEPHCATWLSWPHNRDTWPGAFANALVEYEEFAKTIARFEPVNIVASGEALRHAEKTMKGFSNVAFFEIPTNDAWIRDHGPIFLANSNHAITDQGQVTLVDFEYNGWGGKYPPFDDDNLVPKKIAEQLGCDRIEAPFVLEGGAIDGNGSGIVLSTRSCLFNTNRNPKWNEDEIERLLREFLLVDHVLWLGGEIAGDDTDGHVDQIARFVSEDTILYSSNGESPGLEANGRLIDEFSARTGIKLNAMRIPMPQPRLFHDAPVPMSYANFYILNEAVIVPEFGDANDETAREIIAEFFPSRQIILKRASSIAIGLGAFHCLTQQQPVLQK